MKEINDMNTNLNIQKILRRVIMIAAIAMMTVTGAWAQVQWSGTKYFYESEIVDYDIIIWTWSPTTIFVDEGVSLIIRGNISGTAGGDYPLYKEGKGDLVLSGNNTLDGIELCEGNLSLGEWYYTQPEYSISNSIRTYENTTLNFYRPYGYTYNGIIRGEGNVWFYGGGFYGEPITLTSPQYYTGWTVISGELFLAGNGSIEHSSYVHIMWEEAGASILNISAGDKTIKGFPESDFDFAQPKIILGSSTLTIGNTGQPDGGGFFPGTISGTGGIIKKGTGTLTLSGNNSYSGATTIDAGTLALVDVYGNGRIENSSVSLTGANAIFDISAGDKTIKNLTGNVDGAEVILGSKTLTISDADNLFAGFISGTGSVIKHGMGTWFLTGVNTYTGGTTISEGALRIGNGTTGYVTGNILNNGALYFNTSDFYIYSGVISGTGTVTKQGGNTVIFTGNNTYTGRTSITSGILCIGNGSTTGAISNNSNVNNNWGLQFNRSDDYVYNGVISGSGHVTHLSNTGSLTLGGENTYTGTTATCGRLIISATGSIANSEQVYMENDLGVRLDVSSGDKSIKALTGTNPANNVVVGTRTLTIGTLGENNGGGSYLGYFIGTGGSIIKQGTALLSLNERIDYMGSIIIREGTLSLGQSGDISSVLGVNLTGANTIFSITSGNKTITNLTGDQSSAKVNLGANTLTISNGNGTYSGSISGTGSIIKQGAGTLILNENCDYTGETEINDGTLALGTSGNIASSYVVNLTGANAKFDISADDKTIKNLTGTQSTADVNLGGRTLTISDGNGFYSGTISGTGGITKQGAGTTTFDGVNTYSGTTTISNGTLALGANGTIENSSSVNLTSNTAKLNISANKRIKNLNSDFQNAEVQLSSNTLTIGTINTTDGGGTFKGYFSGANGAVTKTGNATFVMDGDDTNSATGQFLHNQGRLEISNNWKGNYNKATGAELQITGTVRIDGTVSFMGGNIDMDLDDSSPSMMIVSGAMSTPSGTNTLNITSGEQNGCLLFMAASGISANRFTVNMLLPGYTPTLEATGTALLLNAITEDTESPVPGDEGIIAGTDMVDRANLSWIAATDNITPATHLIYWVYQSSSNNIGTAANCEANGTLLNGKDGTANLTSHLVTGLTTGLTYYFNVVVADAAGNKAVYTAKELFIAKGQLTGNVTVSGNAVFGETLAANTDGLSSQPAATLGALSYQWKRGENNISGATNSTYALTQADIGNTIAVTVTAANCSNSVSSASMSAVVKATQTVPAMPTLLSRTATSITLNVIDGCEYRINKDGWQTWQNSALFTGLTPETNYEFQARRVATSTHNESEPSNSAMLTTAAAGNVDIYAVTVVSAGIGATGSGNYEVGEKVNIFAGTPPSGKQFKNWTTGSSGVTFANASSPNTSFDMPAREVTVTANFEDEVITGASLNNIEPEGGRLSPAFSPDKTDYRLLFDCWQNKASLKFTPYNSSASVTVDDAPLGNDHKSDFPMAQPGTRTVTVTVYDGTDRKNYAIELVRPFEAVVPVWNDVLSVINNPAYNGGYTFTQYQWYSDKEMKNSIQGATGPNIQVLNNKDTDYTVWLVAANGAASFGCAVKPANKGATVNVYPNPATDKVTVEIESPAGEFLMELRNMQGATLQKTIMSQPLFEVNMKGLPAGVYLLTVGDVTVRIVKE